MGKDTKTDENTERTRPPATTPEGREQQLTALARSAIEKRILNGTAVIVKLATWDNGESEYRVHTNEIPSQKYEAWVDSVRGELIDGEYEYDYEIGHP